MTSLALTAPNSQEHLTTKVVEEERENRPKIKKSAKTWMASDGTWG
jgi:hypothetical protein